MTETLVSVVDISALGVSTVKQHWLNVSCFRCARYLRDVEVVGLMLGQRRRRWTSIKPALYQLLLFAKHKKMNQC